MLTAIFLFACSNNDKNENSNTNRSEEDNNNEIIEEENNNEIEDVNNTTNEAMRDVFTIGDEILIEVDVHMSEDNNNITIQGTSNLLIDSKIWINIATTPYQLLHPVAIRTVDVQEDGTFTFEHDLEDNFFVDNNERSMIVEIILDPKDNNNGSLAETYGLNGENLKGPLIYQRENPQERQVAEQEIYFVVEGGENTYSSITQELQTPPDDYGKPEVWMEAEIVDNDHHFLYVEGKSNLLEGLELTGRYFAHEDSVKPYLSIPSTGKVKPDGTFAIEVPYEDISEEGFVQISSNSPIGELNNQYKEIYGDKYQQLTGEIVKDGLLQDSQEIELIIGKKEKSNLFVENGLVSESDGELKIRLPDNILFDLNESSLKSEAKATLDDVINLLEQMDINEDIQIHGHTDNQGTMEINQPLSEDRATSVAEYLKDNGDLSSYNLNTVGFADIKPIASNEEEEGRQQNRRVEIIFQEKS